MVMISLIFGFIFGFVFGVIIAGVLLLDNDNRRNSI